MVKIPSSFTFLHQKKVFVNLFEQHPVKTLYLSKKHKYSAK